MKSFASLVVLGLISFGMIEGCSNQPDIPTWYLQQKSGYIVGTGSAKANESGDLDFQKNEAMLNARTALASNIKAAIEARGEKEKNRNEDGSITNNTSESAAVITKVGLQNAKLLHSKFMDNGTLFIQLGAKTDIITGKVN